jgi:hypothetical protein
MAKKHKGGGSAAVSDLHSGLTTKIPSATDSSTQLKGPSVNSEATRSGVGKQQGTLGPRCA